MTKKETEGLLKGVTDLVQAHDKKLALDYQSIQRLEKDSDNLVITVDKLGRVVSRVAGSVDVQAKVVYAVLAVTVLGFLGLVTENVYKTRSQRTETQQLLQQFSAIIKEAKTETISKPKKITKAKERRK